MDCTVCVTSNDLKRLSTISEYSDASSAIVNDHDDDRTCVDIKTEKNVGRYVDRGASSAGISQSDSILDTAGSLEGLSVDDNSMDDEKNVRYFLVDDSPMAKFSRSAKWAYKKVSNYHDFVVIFDYLLYIDSIG